VVTGAIFPHILAKSTSPNLGPFLKDVTLKIDFFLGLLSSDTEAPGPNEANLLNGNRLMIDFESSDKNHP
jgi:hypothetical protein